MEITPEIKYIVTVDLVPDTRKLWDYEILEKYTNKVYEISSYLRKSCHIYVDMDYRIERDNVETTKARFIFNKQKHAMVFKLKFDGVYSEG